MILAFVPVVPPPPRPSPEAQELGRRLADTIESFKREHPKLKGVDIQQAMRLALMGRGAVKTPMIALVIGLAVAAGVLGVLLSRPGPEGETVVPVVIIVVVALVAAILAIRLRNRG